MGFWLDLLSNRQSPVTSTAIEPAQSVQFSTIVDPGVLYGVQTLHDAMSLWAGQRAVTRPEAIAVPAVKRSRDLIAGTIGELPLQMLDKSNSPVDWVLFSQPEAGVSPTNTLTRIVDDLLFHGVAWLRVTHFGWHGKPAQVIRLEPETVTVQPDRRVYYSRSGNGSAVEWVPDDQLIRIESPNDPLLLAGARAIRSLTRLDNAALNYADGTPPLEWFSPSDSADPADDEDIVELLDAWKAARRARSTAYVPASLDYHQATGFNPEQLQLQEARQFAITEIARLTGLDTEDLGVSTTSRTYFNAQDRRRAFLDFTLGPYIKAIESRLSMEDVTPRGYRAKFDTSEFARADDLTGAQTDQILITSGVMTVDEIRARRGLQPLPERAEAPAPAPQEESADAL